MSAIYRATAAPITEYTTSSITADYTIGIGGLQSYIQNLRNQYWDVGTAGNTTAFSVLSNQIYGTEVNFNRNVYTAPLTTDVATNASEISIYNDLNITAGNCYIYPGAYGAVSGSYISTGYAPLDPKEIKRIQIRSRMSIFVKSRACPISGVPQAERVALETLRETISESDFRRYLKYGFLMIRGSSGDMFQVHREAWKTKVYRGGDLIEEVCVRIKDTNIPPTDNVIAFKTIIESDDEAFRAMGNRFNMSGNFTISNQNQYLVAA